MERGLAGTGAAGGAAMVGSLLNPRWGFKPLSRYDRTISVITFSVITFSVITFPVTFLVVMFSSLDYIGRSLCQRLDAIAIIERIDDRAARRRRKAAAGVRPPPA